MRRRAAGSADAEAVVEHHVAVEEELAIDPPPGEPAPGKAVTITTNRGAISATLKTATAPCTTSSFTSLAKQGYFDDTKCHRLTTDGIFVLQCGDPTGSGSGGPSYKFAQEVPAGTTYPRGTIAMANTGQPNSTGSQFFLCFVDTQLSPDYTPVGTVDEAGLAVLDKIAAAGNNGSFEAQAGGGAPNLPVTINTMSVVG